MAVVGESSLAMRSMSNRRLTSCCSFSFFASSTAKLSFGPPDSYLSRTRLMARSVLSIRACF